MIIGITGTRQLTRTQTVAVRTELQRVVAGAVLHVGDAQGIDALALAVGRVHAVTCQLHQARSREPWQLQARSKRLVHAVACSGTLHAWPNKACPAGLTLNHWKGSGTWGTMRYAASLGVPIVLHHELLPLNVVLPDWLQTYGHQLALF